jgi:AAA15 family ATPase/GTPase
MAIHAIQNLEITNFKCFKDLKVSGIGRVNLIGGKNNVGKTAFLEAAELFVSSKKASDLAYALYTILKRRQNIPRKLIEFDLIYNDESILKISSASKYCSITRSFDTLHQPDLFYKRETVSEDDISDLLPTDLLTISVNNNKISIPTERFLNRLPMRIGIDKESDSKIYISSSKSSEQDISIFLGALINLGIEDLLNYSLSLFDKNISELKQIATEQGVILKLKLKNKNSLVLLSSLGEGVNRYIAILCAIWANKDSFLLIDEIENGIHYTNYKKLWEIIFEASVAANCQLFITTHSKECIEAFNEVQFENESCNAQYFEFYKNLKTGLIDASGIDKEQLRYSLTHEGRVRGE